MKPLELYIQQQHDINASVGSPPQSVGLAFWSALVILILNATYRLS